MKKFTPKGIIKKPKVAPKVIEIEGAVEESSVKIGSAVEEMGERPPRCPNRQGNINGYQPDSGEATQNTKPPKRD